MLADASPSTTFRYLRQDPYLRSYNHNGRFHTPPVTHTSITTGSCP